MLAPRTILKRLMAAGKANTQADLAALLGVSQPTVSAWLAGKQEMTRPIRLLAEKILKE